MSVRCLICNTIFERIPADAVILMWKRGRKLVQFNDTGECHEFFVGGKHPGLDTLNARVAPKQVVEAPKQKAPAPIPEQPENWPWFPYSN